MNGRPCDDKRRPHPDADEYKPLSRPPASPFPLQAIRPHRQLPGQSQGWVWSSPPGIWPMRSWRILCTRQSASVVQSSKACASGARFQLPSSTTNSAASSPPPCRASRSSRTATMSSASSSARPASYAACTVATALLARPPSNLKQSR